MNVKEIDEYYNDQIKFLHPYLKKDDFIKIMTYGFRTFLNLTKHDADISIKTWRHTAYCGYLFKNIDKWWQYMYDKHKIKLRLVYNFTLQEFNGIYYFGLTDEEYKKYKSKLTRKTVTFNDVLLFKIKEECFLYKLSTHFFAVYRPVDLGFVYHDDVLIARNFKEIAYRDEKGKIVNYE